LDDLGQFFRRGVLGDGMIHIDMPGQFRRQFRSRQDGGAATTTAEVAIPADGMALAFPTDWAGRCSA
jgi:hypothetical protein